MLVNHGEGQSNDDIFKVMAETSFPVSTKMIPLTSTPLSNGKVVFSNMSVLQLFMCCGTAHHITCIVGHLGLYREIIGLYNIHLKPSLLSLTLLLPMEYMKKEK
jgi:hypothetical protein